MAPQIDDEQRQLRVCSWPGALQLRGAIPCVGMTLCGNRAVGSQGTQESEILS